MFVLHGLLQGVHVALILAAEAFGNGLLQVEKRGVENAQGLLDEVPQTREAGCREPFDASAPVAQNVAQVPNRLHGLHCAGTHRRKGARVLVEEVPMRDQLVVD